MRVFVTGATGFIGSAVVQELLKKGHQVLGLARSEKSAEALRAAGAEVLLGSLEDLDSLKLGATTCDGVIHTGFIHDFANFEACCKVDIAAVEAMGSALAGTNKPFVSSAGALSIVAKGPVGTEEDPSSLDFIRSQSDHLTIDLAKRGVRSSLVRLPPTVHGKGDHGFVPMLINFARERGASAYIEDGANVWSAVHRTDAASVFVLALEKGEGGKIYHAVAEQGIPTKDIAEAIGKGLHLPVVSKSKEEAVAHFDPFFAMVFARGAAVSSEQTRRVLGWQPVGPTLLQDIQGEGDYF
eukprot:gene1137-1241_t